MKKITACLAGVLGAALLLSAAGCGTGAKAFSDPDATIKVSETPAAATRTISDRLFGIFLEDINYTSQAMDDNLLANSNFEGIGKGFSEAWRTSGNKQQGTANGVSPTSGNYLALSVSAGARLTNDGFVNVPIHVEKGVEYEFSAFLRASDYAGKIDLSVTDDTTAFAAGSVEVKKSSEWVKYVTTLKATATGDNLKFRMDFAAAGSLDLDGVELVTKDATNGIKNYVYNALKDLQPKFVRFPGGCIIEGKNDTVVYDWKNSVGAYADPETKDDAVLPLTYTENRDGTEKQVTTYGEDVTRKPNNDLWANASAYYAMEYGVGFYEYFLMCEDFGAEPVPILNCGLGCMGGLGNGGLPLSGRHDRRIDDFIQDAKDLICFANGSAEAADENEAYWAGVRVKMGHPEPFGMEYLGIGNEQWGANYYANYQKFLEAFKADPNPIYQTVTPIVGTGTQFADTQGIAGDGLGLPFMKSYRDAGKIEKLSDYGIVDHHYYMNYLDFFYFAADNMTYNTYSREAGDMYKVFVGEYSANESRSRYVKAGGEAYTGTDVQFFLDMPAPMNSWLTALSEAAYMTGLERNGDVVELAAYAPVFGVCGQSQKNDDANQWDVDMIYFTPSSLLLTPNYYVQQAFMSNSGTKLLSSAVTYKDPDVSKVGLNTATGVEYVDRLYYVVSYDGATGDVIVKIVNAGKTDLEINVELGESAGSSADVIVLKNENGEAVNTLQKTEIAPETSKLSGVSSTFGYKAPKYSVNVIRIHAK